MPSSLPKLFERRVGLYRTLSRAEDDTDTLDRFACDPDAMIETHLVKTLKDDKTSTVTRIEIDGRDWIVKRYNNRNRMHPIKRAARRSRADYCFRNALELLRLGIATPAPIAAIEERLGPLRGRAWLITKPTDGMDLIDWFAEDRAASAHVIEQILHFFSVMDRVGIAHGDMKATNLLVANDRLYVIDLDGMRRYRMSWLQRDQLARDARRFMKNWRQRPEVGEKFESALQKYIDAESPLARWWRQGF